MKRVLQRRAHDTRGASSRVNGAVLLAAFQFRVARARCDNIKQRASFSCKDAVHVSTPVESLARSLARVLSAGITRAQVHC